MGGEDLDAYSESQRDALGKYLVLAINFFRECVSGFVDDPDPELRIKVWLRLSNIVFLQKHLMKFFDQLYNLPLAYAADKSTSSKKGVGFAGLAGNQFKFISHNVWFGFETVLL